MDALHGASPGRFLGASDLGLVTQWRLRFVPPSTRAEPTPGVVYLDVGGQVDAGIIDHHAGETRFRCTAEGVLSYREPTYTHLLGPWLARFDEGRLAQGTTWRPTIITHENPDWDSLIAVFLLQRLVEDGDFPPYALPLASYARVVDQGQYAVDLTDRLSLFAPHFGYLAIQNSKDSLDRGISSSVQIERGLQLLNAVAEDVVSTAGHQLTLSAFLPPAPGATAWTERGEFADLRALLDAEPALFDDDRSHAEIREDVVLPASDGGDPIAARTFILSRPPKAILNKYWVRGLGYPFFICPYGEETSAAGPSQERRYPRVILSLDPNYRKNDRCPSLRGLGFALEQAESDARRRAHGGTDDRRGPPRFGDGYCNNNDPWYDGRAFNYTIVDSPIRPSSGGTTLTYQRVVDIACSGTFWQVPVESMSLALFLDDENVRSVCSQASASPGLREFPGITTTLRPLYADSTDRLCPNPELDVEGGDLSVTSTVRCFPAGTSPPFRIVRVVANGNISLETLVALRDRLCRGARLTLGCLRLRLGTHFTSPELVERLVLKAGGGGLTPVDAPAMPGRVLCSAQNLVLWERDGSPTDGSSDALFDVAAYAAFLREALMEFSERVARSVPPSGRPLDSARTEAIRRDFLRFKARYRTSEVSTDSRIQPLFRRLTDVMGMEELDAATGEVLERLADLEDQLFDRRKLRADKVIQGTLYFLSVIGLLRIVMLFLSWTGPRLQLWLWGAGVLTLGVLVYCLFLAVSPRR